MSLLQDLWRLRVWLHTNKERCEGSVISFQARQSCFSSYFWVQQLWLIHWAPLHPTHHSQNITLSSWTSLYHSSSVVTVYHHADTILVRFPDYNSNHTYWLIIMLKRGQATFPPASIWLHWSLWTQCMCNDKCVSAKILHHAKLFIHSPSFCSDILTTQSFHLFAALVARKSLFHHLSHHQFTLSDELWWILWILLGRTIKFKKKIYWLSASVEHFDN